MPQKDYKQQHAHTHSLARLSTVTSVTQPKAILHKGFNLKNNLVFSILLSSAVSIIKHSSVNHLKTEQQEL